MSDEITSFRAVIDLWPTKAAFASDLARHKQQETAPPARTWHQVDRIPTRWWDTVIAAAAERGFVGVTYPVLTEIWKRREAE